MIAENDKGIMQLTLISRIYDCLGEMRYICAVVKETAKGIDYSAYPGDSKQNNNNYKLQNIISDLNGRYLFLTNRYKNLCYFYKNKFTNEG